MNNSSTQQKHNLFISFHHKDEAYKLDFEKNHGHHFISKSVQNGDIDPENKDTYTKKLIQEEYISDSSILMAFYGAGTHERKHVDWEISAALSAKVGGHSGFAVMILPTFPVKPFHPVTGEYDVTLLFPYLHDRTVANIKSGYAPVYFWGGMYPNMNTVEVPDLLHDAFQRRVTHKDKIDNSDEQYKRNL